MRKEKKQKLILKEENVNDILKEVLFEASMFLDRNESKDELQTICSENIKNLYKKLDCGELKVVFNNTKQEEPKKEFELN